jgi:hypothetical protein
MTNITLLLQDSLFVLLLLALMAGLVFFLYGAVRAGYRRAMIEHMQNMTESPRLRDNTEKVELEDIPKSVEHGNLSSSSENKSLTNSRGIQSPKVGVFNVQMLAPNTAQYGRAQTTLIPSIDGIPLSAFPNIEMRNPWSLANIEAAEVPEKAGCRKTVTGVFYDCGVLPSNHCE